ncbi:hypothetical protein ACFYYY_18120 [Streptomyces sp. NPDC001834]|uniref:hypothetical protein n=1 Tax=Streptomyces sp. NPDC001834 TaxID=3364616 RepID=UPI00368DFE7A
MRKALRWAMSGALMLAAATGCSDGSDKEPDGLSASQVCDGTLTASAATTLERIGETDRFTELTGTNDIGDPNKFSVKLAAKRLHEERGRRSECSLYKVGNDSGYPLMTIDFEPVAKHPDPDKAAKNMERDETVFPLGLFAYTAADNGAYLYFSCPTEGPEGNTPYVKAEMYSSKAQMNADSTGKDRMTILNAVSRSLAKELGCAAQAKLPAKVPDALATD